mmetsp:Transcript_18101/g.20632  ORF Transcript_18101/g.20632 Transcript_18101/m.20632 type:complete len:273 (-) Transcript_18101:2765-3583(-)
MMKHNIASRFETLPLANNDSTNVHDLNLIYQRVMTVLINAMQRKPRVKDSLLKMRFGKERFVLQWQLFRRIPITQQYFNTMFGPKLENLKPAEIISNNGNYVIIHLHSMGRFSSIFTGNLNEMLVGTLRTNGHTFGCTAKVYFVLGHNKQQEGNGYVVKEEYIGDNHILHVETDACINNNNDDCLGSDGSFDSSSDSDSDSDGSTRKRTVMKLNAPMFKDGKWSSYSKVEGKEIIITCYRPIRLRINMALYVLCMTLNRVPLDSNLKIKHAN